MSFHTIRMFPACVAALGATLALSAAPATAQMMFPCQPGYMHDPNPEPWRTIVPCVRVPADPTRKAVVLLERTGPVVVRGCGPTAETTAVNIRAYGGFFRAGQTAGVYIGTSGPRTPTRIQRNVKGTGWVEQVSCTPITVSEGDNRVELRHADGLAGVTGKAVISFRVHDLDWLNCGGGGSPTPGLRIAPTGGIQINFDRDAAPACPR